MAYFGDKKRKYQAEWRKSRRQQWIDAKGPCKQCGSNESLEIDHINPDDKQYHTRELWSRSAAIRDAELAKCQVLCWSCHQAKTKEEHRERFFGKPNFSARTIPDEKYLMVQKLVKSGMSERKACGLVGMCRGTYSSIKNRGHRKEVFGSRGR
jgi:hypothetical protein